MLGEGGLLSRPDVAPRVIVDSHHDLAGRLGEVVREAAEARGIALLAAPVSGNPKVVAAGRLTIVRLRARATRSRRPSPYLELFGARRARTSARASARGS